MSGFQQTMQMLNEGIVPTAMLVANDQMALGAMRAITESGLRVGADISVVGYDDTEDSSCYIPPLTTIKQDFHAGANQRGPLAATLSGPGGEGQSAVARLTGEKKNHPSAQYANRLSPRVGRFINAAGTTSFPTGKRAVSATQLM